MIRLTMLLYGLFGVGVFIGFEPRNVDTEWERWFGKISCGALWPFTFGILLSQLLTKENRANKA